MTRMTPNLQLATIRFTVHSNIEVPLTVDATDWAAALATAMELLERSERVPHLVCQVSDQGIVTARDPDTGDVFQLDSQRAVAAQRWAA